MFSRLSVGSGSRANPSDYMINRAWNSAVLWAWGFTGLRLASGILLLPLLLRFPRSDFGLYYVLLSLVALVPLFDLGLWASIDRSVSYAMGGATTLQGIGVAGHDGVERGPNFTLLWKLLHAARKFYQILSGLVFLLLGIWGTYVVGLRVNETSDVAVSWLAWWITLAGAVFEMYTSWWSVYLRALNRVRTFAQIGFFSQAVRLVLAAGLLLAGAGLLSVPIAAFISNTLQRYLARRACLQFLAVSAAVAPPSNAEVKSLLRTLWPNSWRVGLHILSSYLTANANVFLCLRFLGLGANGVYGLSLQVVAICQSIAQVWLQVKWPYIFQLRSRHAGDELREVFQPRFRLTLVTYLVMSVIVLAANPEVLGWVGAKTTLLAQPWLTLIIANGFLEMTLSIACSLIATSNRTPFLRATVTSNCGSLIMVVILLQTTPLGLGALVIGPLVSGLVFNYWHWIAAAARDIGSSLVSLLFKFEGKA